MSLNKLRVLVAISLLSTHAFGMGPKPPAPQPANINFDEIARGPQPYFTFCPNGIEHCGIEIELQRPLPVTAEHPANLLDWCSYETYNCDENQDFYFLKKGHLPNSLEADFVPVKLSQLKQAKFEIPPGKARLTFETFMDTQRFLIKSDSQKGSLALKGSLYFYQIGTDGLSYLSYERFWHNPENAPTDSHYCDDHFAQNHLPCVLNRSMENTAFRNIYNASLTLPYDGISSFPSSAELQLKGADGQVSGKLQLGVAWKSENQKIMADVAKGPIYYTYASNDRCPVDEPVAVALSESVTYNVYPTEVLGFSAQGFELSDHSGLITQSSSSNFYGRGVSTAFKVYLQNGQASPDSCVGQGAIRCYRSVSDIPQSWKGVRPESPIGHSLLHGSYMSCPSVGHLTPVEPGW
jgi:hypothetical protein